MFGKAVFCRIRNFLHELQKDHIGAYAAQAAYFIMLSFIPFIILLFTLLQNTDITKGDIFSLTQAIVPEGIDSFVVSIIDEVYRKTALTVSISALVAAWSAGKGILALMRGINTVYGVEEKRNYIVLRLQCALYSLVFVAAIVICLLVLVFGYFIHRIMMDYLPFVAVITGVVMRLKDIAAIGFLVLFFNLVYTFLPNRKTAFLRQLPGACFSSVGWYLLSVGFSVYVRYFSGIANRYGSLATLVLLMLWLYFCMYLLLIGAEVNKYLTFSGDVLK